MYKQFEQARFFLNLEGFGLCMYLVGCGAGAVFRRVALHAFCNFFYVRNPL